LLLVITVVTAAAATTISAAAASVFTRLSFIDLKIATHPFRSVKSSNSSVFLSVGTHFHETEATHPTSFPVSGELNTFNGAILSKNCAKVVVLNLIGKIAYID
jgi:hypothetical protein